MREWAWHWAMMGLGMIMSVERPGSGAGGLPVTNRYITEDASGSYIVEDASGNYITES